MTSPTPLSSSEQSSSSPSFSDRVLSRIQTGFPFDPYPYRFLAQEFESTEDEVYATVSNLRTQGVIRRIGATFNPAHLGYVSTLASLAIEDPTSLEEAAAIINSYPEVTHNYLRNHHYNIWFTLIASSPARIQTILDEISQRTSCNDLLNLPATRLFKIRVNFDVAGLGDQDFKQRTIVPSEIQAPPLSETDRAIIGILQGDIGTHLQPFAEIAQSVHSTETDLLERLRTWKDSGLLRRMGAIVRHRSMGVSSNAMTVWDIEEKDVCAAGEIMASFPQVSHCYERPRADTWPANLYTMIHGANEQACSEVAKAIRLALVKAHIEAPEPHLLFSSREFKKSSMRYFMEGN